MALGDSGFRLGVPNRGFGDASCGKKTHFVRRLPLKKPSHVMKCCTCHKKQHSKITPTSPSIVHATKRDTATSPNTAAATKSYTPTSLQLHQILHMPRTVTLQLHQILRLQRKVTLQHHSNFTKYCACHEK